MHFDVIIIGAGAAGMMCAAQAGGRGRHVLLVDHSAKLGERIRISGGGRCNFTNRTVSAENYLSQNPHFCRSALARFSQFDFIAMVEKRRIPYHEREHGQLFCDDSAEEIIAMLRDACDDASVKWALQCAVQHIERNDGHPVKRYRVATDNGSFTCQSLVVATGGLAIPKIGASPFGYRLAEQFDIPVIAPKPALVPLALAPEVLDRLGDLDAVDRRRQDAAGVTGAFAGRVKARVLRLWKSSPRLMRIGDEVRVSTPVSTASGMAKPRICGRRPAWPRGWRRWRNPAGTGDRSVSARRAGRTGSPSRAR
jgi:predicted Rossmann fold flavoprotein